MLAQIDLNAIQKNSGVNDPISVGYLLGRLILPYTLSIAGILLLIYMISGGLQMMFAKGDPKALQSAQGKITTALIGFVVILMAYFITNLIGRIFGVQAILDIFK